jgi:hypothetical protein
MQAESWTSEVGRRRLDENEDRRGLLRSPDSARSRFPKAKMPEEGEGVGLCPMLQSNSPSRFHGIVDIVIYTIGISPPNLMRSWGDPSGGLNGTTCAEATSPAFLSHPVKVSIIHSKRKLRREIENKVHMTGEAENVKDPAKKEKRREEKKGLTRSDRAQ